MTIKTICSCLLVEFDCYELNVKSMNPIYKCIILCLSVVHKSKCPEKSCSRKIGGKSSHIYSNEQIPGNPLLVASNFSKSTIIYN
jgi:hypothetical protein